MNRMPIMGLEMDRGVYTQLPGSSIAIAMYSNAREDFFWVLNIYQEQFLALCLCHHVTFLTYITFFNVCLSREIVTGTTLILRRRKLQLGEVSSQARAWQGHTVDQAGWLWSSYPRIWKSKPRILPRVSAHAMWNWHSRLFKPLGFFCVCLCFLKKTI